MPSAIIPTKGSENAAGFDITATTTTVIPPGTRMKIPTGLKTRAPEGTYLRIAPRSRLAVKGIDVAAGVVDKDYNGEIQVVLVNTTETPFHVLQRVDSSANSGEDRTSRGTPSTTTTGHSTRTTRI